MTGDAIATILACCAKTGRLETGGILVGEYALDLRLARVTRASAAPPDGRSGSTWFVRGVGGLHTWLAHLWSRRGGHYLGEWHYHPFADPSPSGQDIRQMRAIARSPRYSCREPILLVVGGDPRGKWSLHAEVVDHVGGRHLLLDAGREPRTAE